MTDTKENSKQDAQIILNSKSADSSSKIIFDDPVLCSQFLRDYIDLPYLKDIQPEDIEDVSEQFVPLFAEERNADRVKRVNIKKDSPFFLISLIEHKSKVDYNVCMQIFRYMVYIWEAYGKEAEKIQKGVTKLADFKYPPILPIVYYEGSDNWTVPLEFKDRIIEGDAFEKFLPNFEYYLVPLRQYSNEQLLDKQDEISLVMLINRMQNAADIEEFRKLPVQKMEQILKDTPDYLLTIISDVLRVFLLGMKLPIEETEELVGKVKDKKMGYLFENMERMDIPAERRKIAAERQEMAAERQEMATERQEMAAERQEMAAERQEMVAERQELDSEKQGLAEEKQSLAKEKQSIAEEKQSIVEEKQKIEEERRRMVDDTARQVIEMLRSCGCSKEIIRQKIQEICSLTEEQASEKIELYWEK